VVPWIVLKALLEDLFCWTTNINGEIFWLIRGPIIISIVVRGAHISRSDGHRL
jgi:hypothetical protein